VRDNPIFLDEPFTAAQVRAARAAVFAQAAPDERASYWPAVVSRVVAGVAAIIGIMAIASCSGSVAGTQTVESPSTETPVLSVKLPEVDWTVVEIAVLPPTF
jgi:hypothetical protein